MISLYQARRSETRRLSSHQSVTYMPMSFYAACHVFELLPATTLRPPGNRISGLSAGSCRQGVMSPSRPSVLSSVLVEHVVAVYDYKTLAELCAVDPSV